jgi:hypothetical protein
MDRRALAVLILVALMAFSGLSGVGTQTQGDLGDTYEIFSVEDAQPWTDGFDDLQNVYMPPGGLIGTDELMAKLEERFILGEITEESYIELKEKYNH